MSFHSTATVIDALKARLTALPIDSESPAAKVFQQVEFYRASNIARAFQDLYVTKDRVCFIVPVNFRHTNDRDRNRIVSVRTLTVDLLIGDRSFDKGAMAALTGGMRNMGVIEMAERIVDDFFDTPLDLADVAIEPDEGAPLLLTSEEKPNDPGRVCWVQTMHMRVGLRRAALP